MTRKRENLVHKIFVCTAIFKLGHSSMARILNLSTIGLTSSSHRTLCPALLRETIWAGKCADAVRCPIFLDDEEQSPAGHHRKLPTVFKNSLLLLIPHQKRSSSTKEAFFKPPVQHPAKATTKTADCALF